MDKSIKPIEIQKGVIALVVLAANFAALGLFVRFLSTGFSLFQQVYLRVLAALILGIILFYKDLNFSKITKIPVKDWVILTFRAVGGYLFAVTLYSQAIIEAKYTNVSFIGTIPLVAILGVILFGEKLTLKKIALILLAFLGASLVAIKDYSQIFSWGRGEFFALASALFFSLTYVARKWQSDVLNNKEISVMIFLLGFLAVFAASTIKGDPLPVMGWTSGLTLAVFGAGFFNVINVFLINYGFQKVEAILASNILTLESAFAIVFGFAFFKELPSLKELLGGAVIVISVIGMNKLEKKEAKKKNDH